jgi:UDP-N-acetylmuramate--alanine ligase
MSDLLPFRRVHLIGAGGAGMSGLAKILAQAGHQVSGSDLKPSAMLQALAGVGITTWVGHRPGEMAAMDLVVASSAVPPNDLEIAASRHAGVPVWERPRLLAAMTRQMPAIGITGTHGKTTGSAMTVTALRAAGLDPSFMVGGHLIDLNTNAHLGRRDLFVLEADEAFGTFLSLELRSLLVTNIEADHLDHYRTLEAMEKAYVEVASRVHGPVVGCVDDPGVRALAGHLDGLIGYGTQETARWRLIDIRHDGVSVTGRVAGPQGEIDFRIPKPGRHVALNATGVLALIGEMGFSAADAASGLASFGGVRRRFEIRAERGGVMIVDDYAHHPTEIAATLAAAREGHTGRIVAVFQPHRYTRTLEHGPAFARALGAADVVVVADVYAAGEAPIPGVNGRTIADGIDGDRIVEYVARRVDLATTVAALVHPGDLVLLLGAGDVTGVADELVPLLVEA